MHRGAATVAKRSQVAENWEYLPIEITQKSSFFFFSILGMNLFGCKFCDDNTPIGRICDRKNFDTLLWATVTVFQVSDSANLGFFDFRSRCGRSVQMLKGEQNCAFGSTLGKYPPISEVETDPVSLAWNYSRGGTP